MKQWCSKLSWPTPAFSEFVIKDHNPMSRTTKHRTVGNPNDSMRILHKKIIDHLGYYVHNMPSATGGIKRRSYLTNAARHCRGRYFYLLDIRGAYDSVNLRLLARILFELDSRLGDEELIKEFLETYCSIGKGLCTGGPASSLLFNIYANYLLDKKLEPLCHAYGIVYSRYTDDLTFSAASPIGKHKRKNIRQIILDAKLGISYHKAQVIDITNKGWVLITGVKLELLKNSRKLALSLPRHYLAELWAMINSAEFKERESKTMEIFQGKMSPVWQLRKTAKRFGLPLSREVQDLANRY